MNARENASLTLANFLPYRLSVLSNRISRAIAEGYEHRFGLTLPEWRIMAVLGESPDISAREVAARTAMDKVAVSRAVSGLLSAGRIERHFAREDRRRSVLALSRAGQQIYEQIVPMALDYEKQLLAKFSAEDRETLDSMLAKLEKIQLDTRAMAVFADRGQKKRGA